MKEKQQTEEAIEFINRFILQLQTEHVIKGVFIDRYAERNEFYELLHSVSSKINILFLEKPVEDEFDKKLLLAVIQTENIQVKYFSEFISTVE